MRTTLLIKVIVQKRLPLLEQTFTRMKVNVQINPNGHDIYTSVQERKKKRKKKKRGKKRVNLDFLFSDVKMLKTV